MPSPQDVKEFLQRAPDYDRDAIEAIILCQKKWPDLKEDIFFEGLSLKLRGDLNEQKELAVSKSRKVL
jgi:hypothetical protein